MESFIILGLVLVPLVGVSLAFLFSSVAKLSISISSALTLMLSILAYQLVGSEFILTLPFFEPYGLVSLWTVNGISIHLILLTSLISLIAILATMNSGKYSDGFLSHLLLLQSFLSGVFLSADIITFYIFWEATLIPMYFLIGIWGGQQKLKAVLTFFIFTMVGSLFLLVGFIWLGVAAAELMAHPSTTFISDFATLKIMFIETTVPSWVFIFIFVGFAVKAAWFPVHFWLPLTYTQTPLPALMLLSGVMAKMGTYGLLIFGYSILNANWVLVSEWIAIGAVIGIIYGAWIAYSRLDLVELLAFSSMSHIGFILLGIAGGNAIGLQGANIQMFNHGITIAALLLIVYFLSTRFPDLNYPQGLGKYLPVLTTCFVISTLSSIGLPGLNGFIGEFNILLGSFQVGGNFIALTIIATSGVILSAVYLLKPIKNIFFGESSLQISTPDLTVKEKLLVLPLIGLIIYLGVAPSFFFSISDASLQSLIK